MTFPILPSNSAATGYNLTRSLRFRAIASATLTRTFGTPTSQSVFTLSMWVKRGALSSNFSLFGDSAGNNVLRFISSDVIRVEGSVSLASTAVFRDPFAWYNIVYRQNGTTATVWVNNNSVLTGTVTVSSLNTAAGMTLGGPTSLGSFDGYLSEVNFIDGQALTPSSFGSTNSTTGVWQPAKYTGTYGTNGFYLPFTDNSALTTSSNVGLGKDFSGNGNYWTTNNISITAGVTYDSMTDVPTLTSARAANYPVLNALQNTYGLQNANIKVASNNPNTFMLATMTLPLSGKFYYEFTCDNTAAGNRRDSIGIADYTQPFGLITSSNNYVTYLGFSGAVYATSSGTIQATYATWDFGDVVNVAIDCATGKVWFGKNGTFNGSPAAGTGQAYTLTNNGNLAFMVANQATTSSYNISGTLNSGQQPWVSTPPTGFVALNAYNLPDSTILAGNNVMDATLYTGNGATGRLITNAASFKPDLVWIKARSFGYNNNLYDSVRGAPNELCSNNTAAEVSGDLTAFNTTGFTINQTTSFNINETSTTYVGWQWQAGQGSSSSNTNGTITSTVSVNASAGFSAVTYTGTGANATVGHGLGVAPAFIIVKNRTAGSTNWFVYSGSIPATDYLQLNATAAQASSSAVWNNTAPTSSVFSIGTGASLNGSGNSLVAYCFASIAGYSAFGKYTGNGVTDGTFVYTGFRSKWIMVFNTAGGDGWVMYDTSRDVYNVEQNFLAAQSSNVEATLVAFDGLSNGFKIRTTSSALNTSGGSYVYFAFAENPFKNSLAR